MSPRDIKFLEFTHLRGPNRWTYYPVLEALIDIGDLEDSPSNTIPGFTDRLVAWIPSLIEHRCSYEERGGFVRRLEEGTWPGHILEHVTLELQNLAGIPGGFGKAREISKRAHYKVIVSAWHPEVTRAALLTARELVLAAMNDTPFDVSQALRELRRLSDRLCLGPSTTCIVEAADQRRIPFIRLNDGNLVQLGYGARSRRIWTAETDRTSAIAEGISRDKDLTKTLLQAVGVPVPEGQIVADAEQAWEAAQDIGLPVVVKPCDGNHGRGVFTNLGTREEIEAAWKVAVEEGSGVIVERFIVGQEHRLLVVGGKMVAAARGDEAIVTGDGAHTVLELIELQINCDPRRGSAEESPLNPVRIDSAARIELARQGFTEDSVPPEGRRVLIQRNGNVAIDCTDEVHPAVAARVSLAARTVGLDIAGVDLVASDISRPLEEQGGAIVEVNAGPGLLMHLKPAEGAARPVGGAIVDHLFPEGESSRIPLVGITGARGTRETARLVARLARLHQKQVGLASQDGLFVDRRCLDRRDNATFDGARRLLLNRSVELAVIENGTHLMALEGIAYDRCQVGVVTSFEPQDLLPGAWLETPEQMYSVVRTQVDVVLPEGTAVLHAADATVMEMAPLCDGEVIVYAERPDEPALLAHCAAGGRAVTRRDGRIVLLHGAAESALVSTAHPAVAQALTEAGGIEPVLAAIGAVWALGVPLELVRTGLETGESDAPAHPVAPATRIAA